MIKNFLNLRLLAKSDSCQTEPEVGMGATTGAGSDCYPHTIIEVADDLSYIVIQSDNYEAVKAVPYGSNVDYIYTANPQGATQKYTLRKNGRYICDGCPMKHYFLGVAIGHRRFYQDPSF